MDWPNVVEEILDVGLSELHACESLLSQGLVHLLKLHGHPSSLAANHLRGEAVSFLTGARRRWTPSMRQRIDLQALYDDALRQVRAGAALEPVPGWPDVCPFVMTTLLDRDADLDELVAASRMR